MNICINAASVHLQPDTTDAKELAYALIREACARSGETFEPARTGIFVATTLSNIGIRLRNCRSYMERGVRSINPVEFPEGLISYLGGACAIEFGVRGINSTVSAGPSSGLDAVCQSIYFLERAIGNRAIILEFSEELSGHDCAITGGACLVLKNASSPVTGAAGIAAIESFFEKKGECAALKKVLQRIVPYVNGQTHIVATAGGCRSLVEEAVRAVMPRVQVNVLEAAAPAIASMDAAARLAETEQRQTLLVHCGADGNSCGVLFTPSKGGTNG